MLEFKLEKENDNLINKYKKITNILSVIRLLIFISFILFVILLISLKDYILYAILSGSSLILFISFILLTNKYYYQYEEYKFIKLAYLKHYDRRKLDLNKFYDLGLDFISKDDYKENDLDLFGKSSIYQYLSLCKSKEGRIKFANYLKNGNVNKDKYQEILEELKDNEEVLRLEAGLNKFDYSCKNFSKDNINSGMSKIKLTPLHFIPISSLVATIIYIILIFTLSLNPFFIFIFLGLNLALSKLCLRNEIFSFDATQIHNLCDSYLSFSKLVLDFKTENKYFNEIKLKIKNEYDNLNNVKKLYSILAMRKNIIFNLISNLVLTFDFFIILIFNNLTKKCDKLDSLFDGVNEVEAILSFSNLLIDNDIYTKAYTSDKIEIVDGIHPLVKSCIPNSITIDGGIILTGSNMSGKTTFMRMVGVNQILKNACGWALAKNFNSPDINVYTSLRINDLLTEGISTFYAEILRMKKINNNLINGRILVLIDEIFKGTNHDERITASLKLIDKLNEYKALFIISTHDFELANAKNITNYHFSDEYIDDKIHFDYKIKKGVSDTKNALYLLKLADII